jgi:hypothetical protein
MDMAIEAAVQEHDARMREAAASVPSWARYTLMAMTAAGVIGGVALIKYQADRKPDQSRPVIEIRVDGREYQCIPVGRENYSCSPK